MVKSGVLKRIKTYEASDYAGLEFGRFKFYYGYEEKLGPEPSEDEDDEREWAFVVTEEDKELMRIGVEDFKNYLSHYDFESLDKWHCGAVLLAGIGIFLHDKVIGDKHE